MHGVTSPRADIVREVIELLLPSLVLRDVVIHHHEEVEVACGIARRPRGAAEDRGVDRLKLPSFDTLAQARDELSAEIGEDLDRGSGDVSPVQRRAVEHPLDPDLGSVRQKPRDPPTG